MVARALFKVISSCYRFISDWSPHPSPLRLSNQPAADRHAVAGAGWLSHQNSLAAFFWLASSSQCAGPPTDGKHHYPAMPGGLQAVRPGVARGAVLSRRREHQLVRGRRSRCGVCDACQLVRGARRGGRANGSPTAGALSPELAGRQRTGALTETRQTEVAKDSRGYCCREMVKLKHWDGKGGQLKVHMLVSIE